MRTVTNVTLLKLYSEKLLEIIAPTLFEFISFIRPNFYFFYFPICILLALSIPRLILTVISLVYLKKNFFPSADKIAYDLKEDNLNVNFIPLPSCKRKSCKNLFRHSWMAWQILQFDTPRNFAKRIIVYPVKAK